MSFRWVHAHDENLPQRNSHFFHPDDFPAVLSKCLGWSSIASNAAPSNLESFRHVTLALSGATPTPAGGILFGEHFGQVAWRHADGKWSWEATGTIESILFAADAPDGTRYAAAEGSVLLRRIRPGEWQRIPVSLEDATPKMVYAYPDGSLLTIWDSSSGIHRPSISPGRRSRLDTSLANTGAKGKVYKTIGYCNTW